jgi:hypothetical protein
MRCLALLSLFLAGSTPAGLTGLVHDADSLTVRIAAIDSGDGSVSLGTAMIPDCCYLGAGLTAVDADHGRVFAFGQYSSGPQAGVTVLMTLSLDGANASLVVPEEPLQAVLAWDAQSERLISARMTVGPASTQWISVDPVDGSISPVGSASTECCELFSGMANVGELPGGGRGLYTVGRPFGASDWQLLVVDLADGAIQEVAALPAGRPGFVSFDDATGQIDMLMQTSLNDPSILYRIDPADGSVIEQAINSAGNCCLTSPGDMASQSEGVTGTTWWIGGNGANSSLAPGFFALSANDSNALTTRVSLDGNLYLHALIVSGAVVDPGLLFKDRFEF